MAGTPEAIERFRTLADPDSYKSAATQRKQELIQQGERILLQHELTSNDPNVSETDKVVVVGQLETAMASVLWQIEEIDEILASFKAGQNAGMNRQLRRKMAKEEKKATVE
jgi:hypothetical protein